MSTLDMKLYVTLRGESSDVTHIQATLVGPFGSVTLERGDAFSVFANDARVPLLQGDYGALDGDAPVAGGDFVFDLTRPADRSARVSVTLPPDFSVTVDPQTGPLLPVRWAGSSAEHATTLEVTGECIHGFSTGLGSDTGSYAIDTRLFDARTGCTLTVRVARHGSGSIVLFGETWAFWDATQARSATIAWSGP